MKIGFAILTYNEPERLLRLVNSLNAVFSQPPIACHHDFGQCALDETAFPRNVRFVRPHLNTGWCHINTPLSALKAFRLLREEDEPDWYVLLSGSDYPVRKANEVVEDLSGAHYDLYMDHRAIRLGRNRPRGKSKFGFGRTSWVALAYDRYCAIPFHMPFPTRALLAGKLEIQRRCFYIRNSQLVSLLRPDRPSRVYGGGFWIQANRRAMNRLLDFPDLAKLVKYFGARPVPEESLFHTVLCNEPDLKICDDHKRYEDWTGGGSHPKWLDVSDLPKIVESGAHFARKFRTDGAVQVVIDQTMLEI
jgi:hypothetical protein